MGKLPGWENTVIEDVDWQEEDSGDAGGPALTLAGNVRPHKRLSHRCGICGKKRPRYDNGQGRRRWRALDLGTVRVYLEAGAPRVSCPAHGVITAAVPWARHGAAHTRFFDDQAAWLAAACSKTTITALMRISWRTVGTIIARVAGEAQAATDRFAGLRRTGSGETAGNRGHKYLVIVAGHDTGLLIWAAPGRETKTVHAFSGQPGGERCKLLTHLSAGGADWIAGPGRHPGSILKICIKKQQMPAIARRAVCLEFRHSPRAGHHRGCLAATPAPGNDQRTLLAGTASVAAWRTWAQSRGSAAGIAPSARAAWP